MWAPEVNEISTGRSVFFIFILFYRGCHRPYLLLLLDLRYQRRPGLLVGSRVILRRLLIR